MKSLSPVGSLTSTISRLFTLHSFSSLSATASYTHVDHYYEEQRASSSSSSSAVYRHALKSQEPTSICWSPYLVNSVRVIGFVDRPLQVYNSQNRFGVFTILNTGKPKGSNCQLRILVEMWNDIAKSCMQHLQLYDLVYVSGPLRSFVRDFDHGSSRLDYKIIAKDLCFIASNNQGVTNPRSESEACQKLEELQSEACQKLEELQSEACQKLEELQSEACQKHEQSELGSGEDDWTCSGNPLYLWQVYFANPYEWWDNRKNKKYEWIPDFKHKVTGEVLWLRSSDPSWVKKQLQLLDSKMAKQKQAESQRYHGCISQWMYDD